MRILVTGAAGFLGSHLTEQLVGISSKIYAVDDLTTGNLENLKSLSKKSNFEFINHDVRNPIDLKVDAIFNFACPASPKQYQIDPVRTIETNFLGVVNLLHLARKNNAILIQASTSEIYGDPLISPQKEEYWGNVNPIGIRSCYDEGKRAAETLCFDYFRQYKTDARVVRIFNTYGPRMAVDDGRVVSNFIVQALLSQDISIYGDGSQSRSFCFVTDLIDGILKVFNLDKNPGQPINLGNPVEFSILQLANRIIEMTESKSKIKFESLPFDDPKRRNPDISRAKAYLNWYPKIGLDTGLLETVTYFKKILL